MTEVSSVKITCRRCINSAAGIKLGCLKMKACLFYHLVYAALISVIVKQGILIGKKEKKERQKIARRPQLNSWKGWLR